METESDSVSQKSKNFQKIMKKTSTKMKLAFNKINLEIINENNSSHMYEKNQQRFKDGLKKLKETLNDPIKRDEYIKHINDDKIQNEPQSFDSRD